MVEIKIIKSKSQIKDFFKFADYLYANCDNYVPKHSKTEKKLFSHRKNPNLNSNEIVGFLAIQQGKVVGRILGLANRIESKENGIVRFSHLDFINDTEVSFALFDAIVNWAKSLKFYKIVGNLGFNDFMSVGLNAKEYTKTMTHSYNYDYYIKHLKDYGFVCEKKYNDYKLTLKDGFDIEEAEFDIYNILKKNKWSIVEGSKKFKIEMYGHKINELSFASPLTMYPIVNEDKSLKEYLKAINKLYNSDDLVIIINNNDDVVGTMLLTQNSAIALQTTAGKVINSKLMYSVRDNQIDYDINWLIVDKSCSNSIVELLALILGKKLNANKMQKVLSNLWLNNDTKLKLFEKYFDLNKASERSIFKYDIEKDVIVNRAKSDLIDPRRHGSSGDLI